MRFRMGRLPIPTTIEGFVGCLAVVIGIVMAPFIIISLVLSMITSAVRGCVGSVSNAFVPTRSVTYEVSGTAREVLVFYRDAADTLKHGTASVLPARVSFTGRRGMRLYLSATSDKPWVTVKVQVKVDGKTWREDIGAGAKPAAKIDALCP